MKQKYIGNISKIYRSSITHRKYLTNVNNIKNMHIDFTESPQSKL